MRKYALYKSSIIDDIQNSLSKIHITVDLWTSGNYKSILGVVGHYIAMDGQLKHNVLAFESSKATTPGKIRLRSLLLSF